MLALQPCLLLSPWPRTGRNSFYVGTCQDEPEQLDDWNRIAELQQRNRVCPPHLKTCYPLESRVSSWVPCQGPAPAGFPLPPGPPSHFLACQGGGPASGQLAGREELRRRFCGGPELAEVSRDGSCGSGAWHRPEDNRTGAVCNRKAPNAWPVRSSRAVSLHFQTAEVYRPLLLPHTALPEPACHHRRGDKNRRPPGDPAPSQYAASPDS